MPEISGAGERAEVTSTWLSWADADYLSARHLLLNDLLVQGANLSNTAIEKYLKTILVLNGSTFPKGKKGHDACSLNQQIKQAGINPKLNEEYLALLVKAYELRYPDLDPGYNIYLNRTKLIVALDETVYQVRKGFKLAREHSEVTTRIDLWRKEGNRWLLEKNCFFGKYERQKLFEEKSSCYELRVVAPDHILEASYSVESVPDDGRYLVEGLKPGKTSTS